MAEKDEMADKAKSPGWGLMTGKDEPHVTGTLEDVARAEHERRARGEKPGTIREIETAVELEMIELEKLWYRLGLPI